MADIVLSSLEKVKDIEDEAMQEFDRVRTMLERLLNDRLAKITEERRVDVALALSEVQQMLTDSGYYKAVDGLLNDKYQRAIDISYKQYQKKLGENFQFSSEGIEAMRAFKGVDLTEFNRVGQNIANEISRGIIDMQFRGITMKQLIQNVIPEVLEKNIQYVKTWVQTGLAGFYNSANVLLAEEAGFEKFKLVGVINPNSRKFCKEHVGEIHTAEEWNAMNDEQGQIAPVMRYGGGYNCTHAMVAVS